MSGDGAGPGGIWHPTIDTAACIGDRLCVEFCKNGVYAFDDLAGHPVVARPQQCVLGCDACAQVCPVQAITFPSRQELRLMVRRNREEARRPA